jgi:hypothetical protein
MQVLRVLALVLVASVNTMQVVTFVSAVIILPMNNPFTATGSRRLPIAHPVYTMLIRDVYVIIGDLPLSCGSHNRCRCACLAMHF